jgi:hypothetical protein
MIGVNEPGEQAVAFRMGWYAEIERFISRE